MTITEFLLARIAEDEAVARDVQEKVHRDGYHEDAAGSAVTIHFDVDYLQGGANVSATRILAECEAKRRIVERHSRCDDVSFGDASTCPDLCDLASVYADHPDYREEWRA